MPVLITILILLFASCDSSRHPGGQPLPKVKVEINKKVYSFEVAATTAARQRGLMFRKHLGADSGMLFVYGTKRTLSFYMRNTFIPLTIAFLDEEFRIVDIRKMEPLDETSVISAKPAQYALEVNRGFLERIGLKTGDKIEFISPIPYITE